MAPAVAAQYNPLMIKAVVFDVDGLLLQSEELWDEARRQLAADAGIAWPDDATAAMMGMSSAEWSRYMHETVELPVSPADINAAVIAHLERHYRRALPWIPGARDALVRIADRWPIALATSSNREIIDLVLERGKLDGLVGVTVSSEEVGAGKPAPDVYLETVRRLGVEPAAAAAIEDSTNGVRSAAAAGLAVVAVPNPSHPATAEALALATVVLESIDELTPAVIERL